MPRVVAPGDTALDVPDSRVVTRPVDHAVRLAGVARVRDRVTVLEDDLGILVGGTLRGDHPDDTDRGEFVDATVVSEWVLLQSSLRSHCSSSWREPPWITRESVPVAVVLCLDENVDLHRP